MTLRHPAEKWPALPRGGVGGSCWGRFVLRAGAHRQVTAMTVYMLLIRNKLFFLSNITVGGQGGHPPVPDFSKYKSG